MSQPRHQFEEDTIRTRIEPGRRRDPVLGFPNPVQGPILALRPLLLP